MKLPPMLRRLLFRRQDDAELKEEMQAHLAMQVDRNLASGMSPQEAKLAARRQFGQVDRITEESRDARGSRTLDELLQDVRFALRMLRKHPGFTVAAVATLALGIGFVTTLFTMINGVAFGQLPFEDPKRIVSIGAVATQFDALAERQESCDQLAFAQPTSANLKVDEFVSRYPAAVVSANFLEPLRARPAKGRGFLPEDGRAGAPRTVLIGHRVWEREFARADGAVGREVLVNGISHTVVGVMPEGFGFPFHQEVWIARRADEPVTGGLIFGRLRAGVTTRQAADQFSAVVTSLSAETGRGGDFVWDSDAPANEENNARAARVGVVPFAERSVKQALRLMLSAILVATFLVLLLACANVANLLLARAVDRKKEMSMRAALGATRSRLIRQMLTETAVVALLGAAGGMTIATWSTQTIWAYMMKERPLTGGAPFWINFDVDTRVFAFVAVTTLLASVMTGLVPALQASRINLNEALKAGGGTGLRVSRFTRLLINAQMAFSVCLVTVAALFVTILLSFNRKSLPYDPAGVFTAQIAWDERRYDEATARIRFLGQLEERLATLPGVHAVGWTSAESLRPGRTARIEVEGANYPGQSDRPEVWAESVSPSFLPALGVGVVAGRMFTAADHATAPAVVVINTAFVQRFGPELEWVGRRIRYAGGSGAADAWLTIVGVAPDLGSVKAGQASRGAAIYRPYAQDPSRIMTLLLRSDGEVERFAGAIRREVATLDDALPVARFQTVQQIIEMERIGMNAFAVLFIACGVGALILASVGIYGVLAFSVRLRTREFGVRMALGADRQGIAWMVLRQGIRQIGIGLAAGVVLAIGASALLRSMFMGFGDSGMGGWIHLGVVVLLGLVGGLALALPARRAARVDPMVALRAE